MRKEQFSVGDLTVDVIRGGGLDPFTKRFYLDPVNGSDGNDGKAITRAKKSLAAGYALLTANKNEVLYVLPGASANVLTAEFDWTKAYTNLIGLGGPNNQARGTRLTSLAYRGGCIISSTAITVASVLHLTGDRCTFSGIIFNNGGANAACLNAVKVAAVGDTFLGCTFQGINNTEQDIVTASSLDIANGCHAPYFEKCIIGANTFTFTRTAAGGHLYFSNAVGGAAPQNGVFKDCMLLSRSETAACPMVYFNPATTASIDRLWLFDNCIFENFSTALVAMTAVFLPLDSGGSAHNILLKNCAAFGYTEWCQTDTSPAFIQASMPITGLGGGLSRYPSGISGA